MAAVHAEFIEDGGDAAFDGGVGDAEEFGDFGFGFSGGEEGKGVERRGPKPRRWRAARAVRPMRATPAF